MPNPIILDASWQDRHDYENSGADALLFSAEDFIGLYLMGIPLKDKVSGMAPKNDFYYQKMLAAQKEVETYLDLKLFRQPYTETKDYVREEFQAAGYVKASQPINQIYSLGGRLNEMPIINYPLPWLTIRRNAEAPSRNLNIIPNGQSSVTFASYAVTFPNLFTFGGWARIPNYWLLHYETGFRKIPADIMELVALLTAIKVLPIIELNVTGGTAYGLASQNLSLDGLSQGVSKINGGNIFQNRLKTYAEQITQLISRLRASYTGVVFDVC